MIQNLFINSIELVNGITHDYGLAIVIITLMVRVILMPLNYKQKMQMIKQEKLKPEIEAIKEKYKDDVSKQQEKLAELYSQNGVSVGACIMPVLQMPLMIGLYQAIRTIATVGVGTVIIPWVSSILARDPFFVLPITTIVMQMLPQAYPYLRWFKSLNMQKNAKSSIVMSLVINGAYLFVIPSGLGIYCLVSGMFAAVEQFVFNIILVRKQKELIVYC